MCKISFTLALLTVVAPQIAFAFVVKGKLVQEGSRPSYSFTREETRTDTGRRVLVTYIDQSQKKAIEEEAVYENGRLTQFRFDQHQTKTFVKIAFTEKKINYYRIKLGEEGNDSEDFDRKTLVVDQVVPFIQENWEKIKSGEKVRFRLIVPYRMESFGFYAKKYQLKKVGHRPAMEVLIKPTSFLVDLAVDDIFFTLSDDPEKHMLGSRGQFSLREKIDGKWKPVIGQLTIDQKRPSGTKKSSKNR